MHGRKIVFKTKTSPQKDSSKQTGGSSDRSIGHVSQSLKTTAAGKRPREVDQPDVVLILQKAQNLNEVPAIAENGLFSETGYVEVGRIRPKAIPDRFEGLKESAWSPGEVYAPVQEVDLRSAPATPVVKGLEKVPSLGRLNSGAETVLSSQKPHRKTEEKMKSDAFDAILDEVLISLLELKSQIKQSAGERDEVKLEEKLNEYCGHLKRLKKVVEDEESPNKESEEAEKRTKDLMQIPLEVVKDLEEGINSDSKLIEKSELLTKQAEDNLRHAFIIEKLLSFTKILNPDIDTSFKAEDATSVKIEPDLESSMQAPDA